MSDEFYFLLSDLGGLSSLIPFVVAFFCYRKTHQNLWWVLFLLSLVWLLSDGICWILAKQSINNFPVFHVYDILSTILYALLYVIVLRGFLHYWFILGALTIYLICHTAVLVQLDGLYRPVAIVPIIASAIPLTLSVVWFIKTLIEAEVPRITKSPMYWINSAILIHFGVGLMTKVSHEFYYLEGSASSFLWIIVIFSNIIHNILFSIGLWKIRTA